MKKVFWFLPIQMLLNSDYNIKCWYVGEQFAKLFIAIDGDVKSNVYLSHAHLILESNPGAPDDEITYSRIVIHRDLSYNKIRCLPKGLFSSLLVVEFM